MSSPAHSNSRSGGHSIIERLPCEILSKILFSLTLVATRDASIHFANSLPEDPNTPDPSLLAQDSLYSCLLTSRTLHAAALPLLYRNISPSKHSTIRKLGAQLQRYPDLGRFIRSFDLSGLTFQEQDGEQKKQTDTALCLLKLLPDISMVETLRGPGFCNKELDLYVLRCVLGGRLKRLRVLEWSPHITDSMLQELEAAPTCSANAIRSLKFRGGDVRLTNVMKRLLSTMPALQELTTDVGTEALFGIPATARLICIHLKSSEEVMMGVGNFMSSRPEITSSLKVLNFNRPNLPQRPYLEEYANFLVHTPKTVISLDLSSCILSPPNVLEVRSLCTHLEELSIGAGLRFLELERILLPNVELEGEDNVAEHEEGDAALKFLTVQTPITDAVAICKLRCRLNTVEVKSEKETPRLRYLDIRSMAMEEQRKLKMSVLLGGCCPHLRIVEFSEEVYLTDERMPRVFGAVGWRVRCRGRRCWIERN